MSTAAGAAELHPVVLRFMARHPADATHVLEQRSPEDVGAFLPQVPVATATALLLRLNPDLASRALTTMSRDQAIALLGGVDPVETALLVARMDPEARDDLLGRVSADLRDEVGEILSYPPDRAGAMMEADVTRFQRSSAVETALRWLRTLGARRVTDLVVTDDDGRFVGVVPMQQLLGADPRAPLGELVAPNPISVHPMDRRDDVVELINRQFLLSVPVVDNERRVRGIIRYAGLLEAAQLTAAADAQQMFGASAEEGALASPLVGVRSRLPWLNINLLTAFMAAAVVGLFEGTLARFTALAVLLPVVAGQSGNTGAQALAVTMRGLALREIRPSHAFRVLRKELVVGLINGLAIATVTALGAYVWSRSTGLALIMFVAMVVSMMCASLAGAAIPIVLMRLGRDPAVASSIVLTTVTDVVGFVSFLGLATLLAGLLVGL